MKNRLIYFVIYFLILSFSLFAQDTSIYFPYTEVLFYRGPLDKIAILEKPLPQFSLGPWPQRPILGRSKPLLQIPPQPDKKQVYKDLARRPKETKASYEQRVNERYEFRLEQWEKRRQAELDRMQVFLQDSAAFAQKMQLYEAEQANLSEQSQAEILSLKAHLLRFASVHSACRFGSNLLSFHENFKILDASPLQAHWSYLREQSALAGFDAKENERDLLERWKQHQHFIEAFETIKAKIPPPIVLPAETDRLLAWVAGIRHYKESFLQDYALDSLSDSLKRLKFLLQPHMEDIDVYFQLVYRAYVDYVINYDAFLSWSQYFKGRLWSWEQDLYEAAWVLPVWRWASLLGVTKPEIDLFSSASIFRPFHRIVSQFAILARGQVFTVVEDPIWFPNTQSGGSIMFFYRMSYALGQGTEPNVWVRHGLARDFEDLVKRCEDLIEGFGAGNKLLVFHLAFADGEGIWAYRFEVSIPKDFKAKGCLNFGKIQPEAIVGQEDLLRFFAN